MSINKVIEILKLEYVLELRQKHTIAGIFLFTISTIFLIFKGASNLTPQTWNVLFWIVLLFSGINAISKSFSQQNSNLAIFNYTLFNPQELIAAKLIYNFIYLLVIFGLTLFFFSIFSEHRIRDYAILIEGVLLGSFGISCVYTFISAVSMGENANNILISILSFPLVIPIFLIQLKITAVAMKTIQDTSISTDFLILIGIDLLLSGIILLLFPFIWRQ